jgi:hypothetical protein
VVANPRISAASTDGCYWLRLFRWTTSPRGHHHEEPELRSLTLALDIGSHINAGRQLLPEAAARDERRLSAVACKRLILIEAPSSAYHRGTAGVGSTTYTTSRGGDLRRFYTQPHQFYGGIDLHARSMYVCIVNQAGDIVVHRKLPTNPEALLKTIAPYREQMVIAVEWTLHLVLAG